MSQTPHARPEQSTIDSIEALRRRFELATTSATVGEQTYELLRPRNVDDLISEEDFAIDERIPYWAECWPSARVMAARVAREDGRGRTLLELGCGVGLVSLAAARVGFTVLATDYYAEALEFTEVNAQRHSLSGVDTRLVDWRRLPADLGTFDLVVASDVLYEEPQVQLIAAAIAATLAPGAVALLTDPGRRTAVSFIEHCQSLGLAAGLAESVPTVDAGAKLTVSLFEIRRL